MRHPSTCSSTCNYKSTRKNLIKLYYISYTCTNTCKVYVYMYRLILIVSKIDISVSFYLFHLLGIIFSDGDVPSVLQDEDVGFGQP